MFKINGAYLKHVGVGKMDGAPGRGSGRYELGSGENAEQHSSDFYSRVFRMRRDGMSETEIVEALNLKSTTELRTLYSRAKDERKQQSYNDYVALKSSKPGISRNEAAHILGVNESTIRSWENEKTKARRNMARATADFLKAQVDEKGMIDVGAGVELSLMGGISKEKLNVALDILDQEGYHTFTGSVKQATNANQETILKVLCPPDTPFKTVINPFTGKEERRTAAIYQHDQIHSIEDYTVKQDAEGNDIFQKKQFQYPASMDSKRLMIRYRDDVAPDGHTGVEKDGTIEIRPGCKDLDLGGNHYSQVRILVDNDRYLKGMAYYSDDIPAGYDVVFNTNKTKDKSMRDVLKKIHTEDPNNPFGSLIKDPEKGGQYTYIDEDGKEKLGLINKRSAEGDWEEWAKAVPSQFLSKQPKLVMKKQLNEAMIDAKNEFQEIMALENPTVKKKLLQDFADTCDGKSVSLQAAAFPRQKYQVILPVPTLSDNEIYAPNFHDGETVALVRYPHGGLFEIPILKVNNRQEQGKKVVGPNALDAVGINSNVAERLSGADFDGDTVMVIPCNDPQFSTTKIKNRPALEGLKGYDAKMEYPERPGMTYMKRDVYDKDGNVIKTIDNTQKEMGVISNLITDMTLKGATNDELARAVRHSMTVIDAGKHKLDYKASEAANNIQELKVKYQTHIDIDTGELKSGGASTLISSAKSKVQVLKRKGTPHINQKGTIWYDPSKPEGALIYKEVHEKFIDPKTGKERYRTQDSTRMAEIADAHKLVSPARTEAELLYADYANFMKNMANTARKELAYAGRIEYDRRAKALYSSEVEHLNSELVISESNQPRERMAQLATSAEIKTLMNANQGMPKSELKKKKQQALARNRVKFGAQRHRIDISPREWEAIQAGAISESVLEKILKYADMDKVRSYATPKTVKTVTPGKAARIRNMLASGYTQAAIAEAVGLSTSTISEYISDIQKGVN